MAEKVQVKGASGERGLFVDDVKVVGAANAQIANTTSAVNSNNVADMPTRVNDILVALRTHGLITP